MFGFCGAVINAGSLRCVKVMLETVACVPHVQYMEFLEFKPVLCKVVFQDITGILSITDMII